MGDFKRFMAMAAVSCMVLTAVTACGNSGDAGSGDEDTNEIKIDLSYELSGGAANYGTPEYNGSVLAIKQTNANKDNKFSYKAIKGGNKSQADKSTNVTTKLITSDGVKGIIGPAASGAFATAYQIATDSKALVVSPSAAATNVTLQDGKTRESVYPYVFHVCFEDPYQGAAMAVYAGDTLRKIKAAIIPDSSSDYAKGLSKAFQDKFKGKGENIVTELNYQTKDTDFNVQLTRVKGMDFDVIYIPGYYNEVGLIIKQAREMGIDVPITGDGGFDSTDLVKLAGSKNLNDIFFATAYTTVGASDTLTQFIADYKKEYSEDPSMFSTLAYDATNALIQSFEKVGNADTEAARKAMTRLDFKGVTGDFTFDETHTPKKAVLVVGLIDDEQKDAAEVDPNKQQNTMKYRVGERYSFSYFPVQRGEVMAEFFQRLVNGFSVGSIYALIALGYTMVYDIIKLINFAHGDTYMLGAYVGFTSITQLYLGSFPALPLAMVACGVLGVVIERITYKPLRNVIRIAALVTAIGVNYFLEYSTQKIMGPGVKAYPPVLSNQTFHMFDIQIQMQQIYILTITIILMLTLQFIIRKTKVGHSMRAVSMDADAARLMGIDVDATVSYTFAVSSTPAGADGVLVGICYNTISPLMGMVPGIKAFVAVVFGGIGIIPGAMFGGFFIGIVEALITAYGSSLYKDAVVYVILALILIIKPAGLLDKNVKEKVQTYEICLQ